MRRVSSPTSSSRSGRTAGPHLRRAWGLVWAAIELSPELPPYYAGPGHLGPAHPMLADPEARLPHILPRPKPEGPVIPTARGDVAVWSGLHQQMETLLAEAVAEVRAAEPLVPERCRTTFGAEALPLRWLWHVARTQANFYESCALHGELLALPADALSGEERAAAQALYDRWLEVLLDERANAEAALPVMQANVRLDFRDHSHMALPAGADLIRAKLVALDHDTNVYLPALAEAYGLTAPRAP